MPAVALSKNCSLDIIEEMNNMKDEIRFIDVSLRDQCGDTFPQSPNVHVNV